MAVLAIGQLGQVGLLKDADYLNAPDNAWTDAENAVFRNGLVEKAKGWEDAFEVTAVPEIRPYFTTAFVAPSEVTMWVYAGLAKIYATDNGSSANITRVDAQSNDDDYGAVVATNWTACVLSGRLILNNGIDIPQQWSLTNHLSTRLIDLENWPSGMTAIALGSYKNFLVAAGINEGSGFNPYLIRWSQPAEPGTIPPTWDYTDPTNLAGRVENAIDSSHFTAMLTLRDSNILYKEHSIIGMDYIGGNSIFAFHTLFEQVGILGRRCVVSFFGRHLVFGDGDIVIHDGQSIESPLDRRMVRYIFAQMDGQKRSRSFLAMDYVNKEAWICYSTGNDVPNEACVWNWRDNTTTIIEIGAAAHIGIGEISGPIVSMDELGSTPDALGQSTGGSSFDDLVGTFDDLIPPAFQQRLVLANPTNQELFLLNETETRDGGPFTSRVVREAIPFRDQGGNLDVFTTKFVREIYLNINGTEGGVVVVSVGGRKTMDDSVIYQNSSNFILGTSRKINCRVSGRIIDLKIHSMSGIAWRLSGYSVVYELAGMGI